LNEAPCRTCQDSPNVKRLVASWGLRYTFEKGQGDSSMTSTQATRFGGWRGLAALSLVVCVAGCDAFTTGSGEVPDEFNPRTDDQGNPRETIFDLFANADDPNTTLEVNRYLWTAALDVLSFLPVQTIDPFSGVFTTGYGTPPGGGRAYRATVFVQEPALEARSLKVALATRGGPVSADTVRAVEDAILTRARQLRLRDRDL